MFVNFPISIHLKPRGALKLTSGLPWNPRNALQIPPNQDNVFRRLPNPVHLNPDLPEQNSTMKSQRPEYQFVPLNPTERVERINKRYVVPENDRTPKVKTGERAEDHKLASEIERKVPVNVVIEVSGEDERKVLAKRPDSEAEIDIEVVSSVVGAGIGEGRRRGELRALEKRLRGVEAGEGERGRRRRRRRRRRSPDLREEKRILFRFAEKGEGREEVGKKKSHGSLKFEV